MCGIYGVGVLSGKPKKNLSKEGLLKLLSELAIQTQSRGRDATGLAVVSEDGIKVVKRDFEAKIFVSTAEYVDCMEDIDLTKVHSFIGHCRAKTKGTQRENCNNHPIVAGNVVGVHNGIVSNDDELFKQFEKSFNRRAKVDSEIIFKLFNHYISTEMCDYKTTLTKVAGKLFGSAAYVCATAESPTSLFLVRNTLNPLEVKLFSDEGLIVFASTSLHLNKATESIGLSGGKDLPLDNSQALAVCLKSNKYTEIELKG